MKSSSFDNIIIHSVDENGVVTNAPGNVNDLLMSEKNRFAGWECWAGVQNITIDNEGDVWRAICRQGEKLGSIFTDFDVAKDTVVCQKKVCNCAADLHLSKARPEHVEQLRVGQIRKAEKSFCAVPWTQISTKPNGVLRACCLMSNMPSGHRGALSDGQGRTLRADVDSLTDAMNSPEMKTLRKRMLAGERPSECDTCWKKEDLGLSSKRTSTNRAFKNRIDIPKAMVETAPDGTYHGQPSYFDLRFGNLCNLKCVMCHPASSSRWYEDYQTLNGQDYFYDAGEKVQLPDGAAIYNWHESEKFWQNLETGIDHIQQIYLVGGEPLLIEQHYNFLELCIRRGVANQITLEYDTNFTQLRDRVLELWSQFKKVILRVSLEDVGERNDYIRFPSRWSMIQANLERVRATRTNIELSYSMTWQLLNVLTITDLWRHLGTHASTRILSTPSYFDVAILPRTIKLEAMARIQKYIDENPGPRAKACHSFIQYLEKNLEREDIPLLRKGLTYLDRLDQIRGTNFRQTFPELAAHVEVYRE